MSYVLPREKSEHLLTQPFLQLVHTWDTPAPIRCTCWMQSWETGGTNTESVFAGDGGSQEFLEGSSSNSDCTVALGYRKGMELIVTVIAANMKSCYVWNAEDRAIGGMADDAPPCSNPFWSKLLGCIYGSLPSRGVAGPCSKSLAPQCAHYGPK